MSEEVTESILGSIKRLIGIHENDKEFDAEIMVHINSSLSDLVQMGVGPNTGFIITDNTSTWFDFIGDDLYKQSQVKLYVFAKVKLGFDSSNLQSATIESYRNIANECAYRLYVENDNKSTE